MEREMAKGPCTPALSLSKQQRAAACGTAAAQRLSGIHSLQRHRGTSIKEAVSLLSAARQRQPPATTDFYVLASCYDDDDDDDERKEKKENDQTEGRRSQAERREIQCGMEWNWMHELPGKKCQGLQTQREKRKTFIPKIHCILYQ